MEPISEDRATPAALEAFLNAEVKKWADIINAAGIQNSE
jgi:tripartite-type tricarboxylate transporter receptor subunit TctC